MTTLLPFPFNVLRLPAEFQQMAWEHIVGPRIHVLRPAPADVFHWLQDFACPIYQALDAETNEDVTLRIPPSTIARIVRSWKLVKGNLSLLHPSLHMGREIPSTDADVLYIKYVAERMGRVVTALTGYPELVNAINLYLVSEEKLSSNLLRARNCTVSFAAHNVEIEDLLPQLPGTVHDGLQGHLDNVKLGLGSLKDSLDLYEADAHNKQQHYQVARRNGRHLYFVVELANRGLANYANPGLIDRYLLRAAVFRQAEVQRAGQRFGIAPTRDLLYLTDPQHPDLFVRL
ncbi:hypothetical protein F4782DRAFT_550184 [Xylaria castorea]|nr:hypothetical protein F4782DRAFT_550184 [Xylaria castorea]